MDDKSKSKEDVKTDSDISSPTLGSENESPIPQRELSISLQTDGECPTGEWTLIVVMLKMIVFEELWSETESAKFKWDSNAASPEIVAGIADEPLVVLLRPVMPAKKPLAKDAPFSDLDKICGGCMDLLPLLIGQDKVSQRVYIVSIETGLRIGCSILIEVEGINTNPPLMALRISMLRVACVPAGKNVADNAYVACIFTEEYDKNRRSVYFPPISAPVLPSSKMTWASLSFLRSIAASDYKIATEDVFVDVDLYDSDVFNCNEVEWNLTRRITTTPEILKNRLTFPLIMEVAGVSRAGKNETRGHYMAFVDASVLLQPGERSVITRVPLRKYDKNLLPEEFEPLLDLPAPNLYNKAPSLAEIKELENIYDEDNHVSYIEIHLELTCSLVLPMLIKEMYERIERKQDEDTEQIMVVDKWIPAPSEPESKPTATSLKKECVALKVHQALEEHMSTYFHKSLRAPAVAAQRLLRRTKILIKNYPACKNTFEYHDVVSAQHATVRRAITSSLEPQPPGPRLIGPDIINRMMYSGSAPLAERYMNDATLVESKNPRPYVSLALRRLELFDMAKASDYINKAMDLQINNRYALWILGAIENYRDNDIKAESAFRLASMDYTTDGTRRTIVWAALHTFYHINGKLAEAFISIRNMRKGHLLPQDWKGLLISWKKQCGEEEHLWDPSTISDKNPLAMSAAFFLCLRLFKFAENMLVCSDSGCSLRGACKDIKSRDKQRATDVMYIRAASLLLQRRLHEAFFVVDDSIRRFGPCTRLSRLRLSCLAFRKVWDKTCEEALEETERFGAPADPAHLYRSAQFCPDLETALQRAARAHEAAPTYKTAALISRLLEKMGQDRFAERWIRAAVDLEPNESDSWAELARQLLKKQNLKEAHAALRSARQAGTVSQWLEQEIREISEVVGYGGMEVLLDDSLCACDSAMFI